MVSAWNVITRDFSPKDLLPLKEFTNTTKIRLPTTFNSSCNNIECYYFFVVFIAIVTYLFRVFSCRTICSTELWGLIIVFYSHAQIPTLRNQHVICSFSVQREREVVSAVFLSPVNRLLSLNRIFLNFVSQFNRKPIYAQWSSWCMHLNATET